MAEYLTVTEARERLDALGVDPDAAATVAVADLRIASDTLDALRPFKGEKAEEDQERQFPRVYTEGGTAETPAAILDYVALQAVSITSDEEPPIIRESAGRTSVEYAYPKTTATQKRLSLLVRPYLDKRAALK